MFTIKNVLPDGFEEIIEVRRASLGKVIGNDVNGNCNTDGTIPCVWGELEDGSTTPFTSGMVYVMNRYGKTVADYALATPMGTPVVNRQA